MANPEHLQILKQGVEAAKAAPGKFEAERCASTAQE
jgi:hypothetical protein